MATRRKKTVAGVDPALANLLQHELNALNEQIARSARAIVYRKENGHYFWGLILARWARLKYRRPGERRESALQGARDCIRDVGRVWWRSEDRYAYETGYSFGLLVWDKIGPIQFPPSQPEPAMCYFR